MELMTASSALLGLRELIKAVLPNMKYLLSPWVTVELLPTLNSVASHIEGFHNNVRTNNMGDHLTRVILLVVVAAFLVIVIILGVWIRDTRETISRFSQGITVAAGEMKIRPSEVFPPVHY